MLDYLVNSLLCIYGIVFMILMFMWMSMCMWMRKRNFDFFGMIMLVVIGIILGLLVFSFVLLSNFNLIFIELNKNNTVNFLHKFYKNIPMDLVLYHYSNF